MHTFLKTYFSLCLFPAVVSAQWVAYNDHVPGTIGTQTHSNATIYNVRGTSQTNSGYLKNTATGANLPVVLTFSTSAGVTYGGTGGVPNSGSPLATNFDGYVYFGSGTDSTIQIPSGTYVTNTFINLDPNMRYSFRGGVVRGVESYSNRWAKASLIGAEFYLSAHSTGVVTSAQAPADLLPNEAAINTGYNLAGEMWDWEDIDPGADGSFAVVCTMYTGYVPNGSTAGAPYGQAISGIRLEEKATVGPIQFTVGPQSQTVVVGDPFSLSVQVRGALPYFCQWYRGTTLLTGATNPTYSVLSAAMVDAGYYYVIASNLISRATSSVAQITITNGFPIVITNQPQSLSVPVGQTAVFNVGASGTRPQYQWFRNGIAMAGATNASLVLTNVQAGNQGDTFYVRVWNLANTNTSITAKLTVDTSRQVLFVANTSLNPADVAISNMLAAQNFVVVVQDDSTSATSQTNNKALVVISSSVDPAVVASKFRDVRVPVITWESALYQNMLFTTNTGANWQGVLAGQQALSIYDTNHPLAAGLRGTNLVYRMPQAFSYGAVGANAYVIATATNPTSLPVFFGYESNSLAANGMMIILGRRVGLFLEDNAGTNLTALGSNLFTAAVTWALGAPVTAPLGFGREPVNLTAVEGNTATFSCIVTGAVRYYFQWQRNGTNIPGATGRTYTTPMVNMESDSGATFSVLVTNTLQQRIVSSNATLTVVPPAPIMLSDSLPNNVVVNVGQSAAFSISIVSGGLPSIQWHKDGVPIPNATNLTYAIPVTVLGDGGHYWAVVTNRVSRVESRHAVLAVMPANQMIMPETKSWRYYTNGQAPLAPIAWYATNFNDTAWPQGSGALGFPANENILGFTFGTLLPRYVAGTEVNINTYYFRTYFNFTNDPVGVQVIVSNVIDDGAVFYLNGVEVARIHVPSGNVNYNTFADRADDISAHGVERFTLSPEQLLPATNVLAVEVHQGGVSSADLIFGQKMALIYLAPTELVITNQPWSLAVDETHEAAFNVGVLGVGGYLQWYHDFIPIPGATKSTFTIPSVATNEAGIYFVTVSNAFSYLVSSNVYLTVLKDTNPPAMAFADGTVSTTNILVTFSEPMLESTLTNTANYSITNLAGGTLTIIEAVYVSRTNVLLTTAPRQRDVNYLLIANALQDASPQHNTIAPDSAIPVSFLEHLVTVFSPFEFFNPWPPLEEPNIGTAWKDPEYQVPESWGNNIAEPGAFWLGTDTLPVPRGKELSSSSALVSYFRTWFDWRGSPLGATLRLRHVIDGGAVVYLNGVEIYRYNMPTGAVDYATRASANLSNPGWMEAPLPPGVIDLLHPGENVLAVELHASVNYEPTLALAVELDAQVCSLASGPVVITRQPANRIVAESTGVSFDFMAAGANQFQWFINGAPIPDATNPTYTIPWVPLWLQDSSFYVVARNETSRATSSVARLTVLADQVAPWLLSAVAVSTNEVLLTFSERLDAASATNVLNYALANLSGVVSLVESARLVNGTNVVLNYAAPFGGTMVLMSGIRDASVARNLIQPNTAAQLGRQERIPLETTWKFNDAGTGLDASWRLPDYDDSSWSEGPALLYNETGPLPAPKNTLLRLSNTFGGILTYYFRTDFNWPIDFPAVTCALTHVIDDGIVMYLNGTEIHRWYMPPGLIATNTLATSAVDNAYYQGPFVLTITNLVPGRNVLAAEVHQNSSTSSDVVFGADLTFSVPSEVWPSFVLLPQHIRFVGTGPDLRLWWLGSGFTLERAEFLTPDAAETQWREVATFSNQVNYYTMPGTNRSGFYKLR